MTAAVTTRVPADERRAALPGAIRLFIETNGYPPTHAELAPKFGVSSTTIETDLRVLESQGIVERPNGVDMRRALRLTGYTVRLVPVPQMREA